MIQHCLISHSLVTLKQVFSPGSFTPWQWSPLHSPDLPRRSTTSLPHAPCRAHGCHGRKSSGSGHAEASYMMDRDHQPPAPEREAAGPGCHWKQKADWLQLIKCVTQNKVWWREKITPGWKLLLFLLRNKKLCTCPVQRDLKQGLGWNQDPTYEHPWSLGEDLLS